MRNFITIFLISFIAVSAIAQKSPKKKDLLEITDQINLEKYEMAAKQISKLLRQYPEDPYLHFQQGLCYLYINHRTQEAIPYLEFAKDHYTLDKWRNENAIETYYYLGQAYHINNRFNDALETFQQLKDKISPRQKKLLQKIEREINYAKNAIKLEKNPVEFIISNLGQAINSEYDEHSPIVSADESLLLFTSNRQGTGVFTDPDGIFYEDIYQTKWREGRWLPAQSLGPRINTDGNDASCSLSADGQELIIYRNDGISGNLLSSSYTQKGWQTPDKMEKPINTSYDETHGSMSHKGIFYFSSNRPGGFGGNDIYMTQKLPNGTWGKPQNLGPTINTIDDEESPFMHPDNKTLYFASTGHSSMGGYDIFKSFLNDSNQWMPPVNIGYPINTPRDDLFYVPTSDDQRVYFASERPGGFGRSDIYMIEFPATNNRILAVVGGFLFTEDGYPSINSQITIENQETGELIGKYKTHPETGKYVSILPTGLSYKMTITTNGYATIIKTFKLVSRTDYKTLHNAIYIDPIVLSKTID